jgi:hypothetical protein
VRLERDVRLDGRRRDELERAVRLGEGLIDVARAGLFGPRTLPVWGRTAAAPGSSPALRFSSTCFWKTSGAPSFRAAARLTVWGRTS